MRKAIKNSLLGIFYILVLPFGLSAKLVHTALKSPRLFHMFTEAFSLLPGYPGMLVRACFYHQTLENAHLDMDVSFGGRFSKMEARVGRGVIIAAGATIGCADIGDGSVIGNRV